MTANNLTIFKILEAKLRSISGLPTLVSGNVEYDPSVSTPFMRSKYVPVSRRSVDMGSNPLSRVEGTYIITVCHPLNVGEGPGLVVADSIIGSFSPHSVVTDGTDFVEIEYSEMNSGYPSENFYCIPVTIGWFAHN